MAGLQEGLGNALLMPAGAPPYWRRHLLKSRAEEAQNHAPIYFSKAAAFSGQLSPLRRTRADRCCSGSPVRSRNRTACENSSGVLTTSRQSAQERFAGRSRTTVGLPVARYSFSFKGWSARVTGRSA